MNQTKRTRRLAVKHMLDERERDMLNALEDKAPNVHAKETIITIVVVALIWYAISVIQLFDAATILREV